jgi:hypothetical protein
MKYKVNDRVFYRNKKWIVVEALDVSILIMTAPRYDPIWVLSSRLKPIITCK